MWSRPPIQRYAEYWAFAPPQLTSFETSKPCVWAMHRLQCVMPSQPQTPGQSPVQACGRGMQVPGRPVPHRLSGKSQTASEVQSAGTEHGDPTLPAPPELAVLAVPTEPDVPVV